MKKNKTTFLGGLILMVCFLAVAGMSYAQTNWGGWCYRDYNANGTFTVPANCTQLYIEAIGAGGGGGNANKPTTSLETRTGTGGGGGAYTRKHVVNPTGNYTITIGVGGGPAAAGTATTVSGEGCNITAGGGQPGSSSIHGVHTTGTGGNGGLASGGDVNYSGGQGGKVCDNRDTEAGSLHDRVGSGAGGGAAGGNGNGGYQDQPQGSGGLFGSHPDAIGTVGAGGGGTDHGLSINYSTISTWYKGGNGGQGLYGGSGWGEGSTGTWPGGGGGGARTHGGLIFTGDSYVGGHGANGFVRVWFYTEKSEPLTVSIENQSTTCPYTLKATTSNYLFTNTLQWNTGATGSTLDELSPLSNTTYSVTVTDKHNYASHTCQITSTASIDVNGCPDCGVSIASATASPSEICEGGFTTLSASVASPDGSATYAWTVNGTAAGSGSSLSYSVTPSGTTTYTIVVTVTKGSCTATDTRDVDVTVNTKVTPTFASLKDKYCAGSVPAASALPTTSDNGIAGSWSVSTSGSTATFTFTPGTGECANTFSKTATIYADPTPGVIEPNIVVCDGSTTYTFASNTDAAGGINGGYRWQVKQGSSPWFTIPTTSANAASYVPMADMTNIATALGLGTPTGTFWFRRVWTTECGDVYSNELSLDNPGTLAPGSITVTGNAAGAYCADANVSATLTANPTSDPAGATFSYQWQSSTDGTTWTNISGATASSYTVSLSPVQKISYRYKAKYSTCDWLTSNNTYDITVKPLPVVLIEGANPYNVTKCANAEIEVTVTGADSYEWQNGSTANPATFPASSDGSYVVTGTTDGCSSTATITITNNPLPTIDVVTPSTASQSITYGQPIANVVFTTTASSGVTVDGLPAGLTYSSSTKTISGTPTVSVGTYTITATAASSYGCDAATKEITITVGKKNLTITYTGTDGDNTKVYDGTPLTLSYDKLHYEGLEGTDAITSGVITTDGYKVGDYICNAGSFGRMWATGTATPSGFGPASVTQNYAVTFNVTLSITPRPLEITANSASKEYDATPLTPPAPGYSFTNGTSLASTDEATIAVSGSQLCPGSSPSAVGDVAITHVSDNEDVTGCYTITKKTGTLTVTPMVCPTTLAYEGYTYPIVQVGSQCWFAENLRAAAPGAVPYNEESSNEDKFGLLYNWAAALSGNSTISTDPCYGDFVRGNCPDGWAIPSAADFDELQTYAAGVKNLRSDNAMYWHPAYLGTDAVNFDERGGGLFNANLNRFEELKTAAYFWTSESVLHAASFPDGVAHTYCDEYYCGEYIPKTITVFSKASIRCIRKTVPGIIPPPSTCPSLGATSLKIDDPEANGYGQLADGIFTISTPIVNYDASLITEGWYKITIGTDAPIEFPGTVSANGLVATLQFNEISEEIDLRRINDAIEDDKTVTITPVLKVTCTDPSGVEIEGAGKTIDATCPDYFYYGVSYPAPDYIVVAAEVNNYNATAIDANQIAWTVTSDISSQAPYTFVSGDNNTDTDPGPDHIADIVDDHTQEGMISMDIINAQFPGATKYTFVPSMVVTCNSTTKTLTGPATTFSLPDFSVCPIFASVSTLELNGGQYTVDIPYTGTDAFSVTGFYSLSRNYSDKYGISAIWYTINAAEKKLQFHVPVDADSYISSLASGETFMMVIDISYGPCPRKSIMLEYTKP